MPRLMKTLLGVCVLAFLASCSKQVQAEGNPTGPAASAAEKKGDCCGADEGGSCCADKAATKAEKGECCGECAPDVKAAPKNNGQ